jgi:hypothetical protein
MGLNLNLDMNKLPHFWQTVIAMVVGGVFIGGAGFMIAKQLNKGVDEIKSTKQAVESIDTRLQGVESTQQEIIVLQASQASQIEGVGVELKKEINGVDGRLRYFIDHQDDMTAEQILDAFDIGYTNGFEDGKKNEMTP